MNTILNKIANHLVTGGRPLLSRFKHWAVCLLLLAGLAVHAQPANDNFANAEVLDTSFPYGTVTNDLSLATSEIGEPSHGGQIAYATVWYQWVAPEDGDVQFDTLGTALTNDTILAVYTGSALATLTQVAVNDDVYPNVQLNYDAQNIFSVDSSNQPVQIQPVSGTYGQPHNGPSLLHFNAKAGTTYYIAVSGKYSFHYTGAMPQAFFNGFLFNFSQSYVSTTPGPFTLNWAFHPAGEFRFATERYDQTGITDTNGFPMPLYETAETESDRRLTGTVNANQYNTTLHTYYSYDAPGVLVTVTRVGGSTGRCTVDYATADLDPSTVTNGDIPAVEFLDYYPASGTLTFDDFEMSKTILIQTIDDFGMPQPNRVFTVNLFNATNDPAEDASVAPAKVDPNFGQALVRILDADIDPKGPSQIALTLTNITSSSTNISTNYVWNLEPTNAVFNFQKANYRVPRDITSSGYWGATPVTIFVNRNGTNKSSQSIFYHVNVVPHASNPTDNGNNEFPLSPGSDYATPSPANDGGVLGTNSDFAMVSGSSGTLTFPGGNNFNPQPIQFTVLNNGNPQFNEDFQVEIYDQDSDGRFVQVGMVDKTTVTILANDLNPPAGSVDEYYNADISYNLIPPVATVPPQMQHPGTDGEVYDLAVLPNDKAVLVGDFVSYDLTGRNCIALVGTNGLLDTTFNPGSGANAFISCVDVDANTNFIIGGAFTSYNGTQRNGVARIKANGQLDNTFNPGAGANGTVWAAAVLSTGKILIAGDFTTFNGVARNHVARLNSDGSLDTSFDPGTAINGPVYAVTFPKSFVTQTIDITNTATGTELEDVNTINLGAATAGTITVNYDMLAVPDDMKIFYGTTNTPAGTGVLIYDSGLVSGAATVVLPFGPTNGVTANQIVIVMNQGNGQPGTLWDYNASIVTTGGGSSDPRVVIGGDFTSVNGVPGQDYVIRLLDDGSVDASFDPGQGANGVVYALADQNDGNIVMGGAFTQVNGQNLNRIARLSSYGVVDANFFCGSGADDTVFSLDYQTDGTIYVGGAFTSYNGTHRLGFARLNSDGTLDTTFLDTAYNQFAGLTRQYFGDSHGTVLASRVQSNGGVLIGGAFTQLGGGQFDANVRSNSYTSADVWPEPKARDGVRSRSNFARLVGGSTAGPGNIGLQYQDYSVNKSQSYLYVSLLRQNGSLGPASANFSVAPGNAQSGVDYAYYGLNPLYWMDWEYAGPSRSHSDGWFGTNGLVSDIYGSIWLDSQSRVFVSVLNNNATSGDLNARFNMANPVNSDQFYLGGQDIPLGLALGASTAPLTVIDDHHDSGSFNFASSTYVASSNAPISVRRTGGTYGVCSIQYATTTVGSTAILGSDYNAASGTLTFNAGVTNNAFSVLVKQSNYITAVEKTVNLRLFNPQGPANGVVSLGVSNAVLRIINANYQGYLGLSTNQYVTNLSAGYATITVNRTVGSKGTLTVLCSTTNNTALNGVDYIGFTNLLTWSSGDVTPRTIAVPLLNNAGIGGSKQFNVILSSPTLNTTSTPSLFAAISVTNATVTINNDNSFGTFQFSAPTYVVNENGGYATLTVNRSGSSLGTATVDYTTLDGAAVSNVNYAMTAGTLTFTQGQLSASFQVPVYNDSTTDPAPDSFYFTATLSNPGAGVTVGSPAAANVEIVDAASYNKPPGDNDPTFGEGAGMNLSVLALALQTDGRIIAGGNFTTVNNIPENYLARLNVDGSLDSSGFLYAQTGPNGPVYAVVSQTDDRVLVGGSFTSVDGVVRNHIGRVMTDGTIDTSFNPGAGADNLVYALAETFINGSRKIYVGGAFNTINSTASRGIARLNNNGTVDVNFNPGEGANDVVYAIAAYPTNSIYAGKVLIGGAFTQVNNFNVAHIARLNADGSLDTNFDATVSADGPVRAIAIQNDGTVLIGGDFTMVNGSAAAHLARLNLDGSLDTTFAANLNGGFNGPVLSIVLQPDNRILVGGDFTEGSSLTRHRITRLLPDGQADPTINFGDGANSAIHSMLAQPNDSAIVIGGAFTEYNGVPHQHIARINGGSVTGSGSFEFTTAAFSADENGAVASIDIRRVGGTSGPNVDGSGDLTVHFSTSDGTALNGVNYDSTSVDVSFPPGETFKSVQVPLLVDHVITNTLTVNLTLSDPQSPSGLGDQSTAVLNIINDDSAVSFSSANYSVSKGTLTGYGSLSVVRLGTTFGTCSVDLINTTNGTAVDGTDYYPTNTTITFNPGESIKTINVPIINNGLPEGNRTVLFTLTNAVNTLVYEPSNAMLTIVDNVNAPGTIQFTSSTYVVNEGDTNAYLGVVRTNGTSGIVSVNYSTVAGTALPGANYITSSGTLTFGDGVVSNTVIVPLVDNSVVQGPVVFTIRLSGTGGGAVLGSLTNASITVLDNDAGIRFAAATNSAPEDGGFANVAVFRLYNTNTTMSVDYATADGTAQAGVNYTATAGTLSFTNGETIKTVSVPLINVTNVTGDLDFSMMLANPTGGAQLIAPSNTVVVVQDANAGLSFTTNVSTVFKNAGTALITVVCSNPRVEPVVLTTNDIPLSVDYHTVDGTALAGTDYQSTSGTLVFTNGQVTNTFTVPIFDNTLVNGNHTFSVVLTNATAPGQLVSPSVQSVVIVDSNSGLRLSQSAYTVFKNGVSANIDVFRTGYTDSVVSVNCLVTNGTAMDGVNFVATNALLVFTNGVTTQSFAVQLIANSQVQPNLTALLQLLTPTNGYLVAPSAGILTILENGGSYVVPAGAQMVSESGAGTPNGILDSNETVQVMFAFRDSAGLNVTNLNAILLATNGVVSPVAVPASATNYGPLTVYGHSVSRTFGFTVHGTNAQPITPTFNLYDNAKFIGTAAFNYSVGSWTMSFTNTSTIVIRDNTNASPYPSSITVSGVGGSLVKATVTLNQLAHAYPADVDALVVSPAGTNTLIMANAGSSLGVTNVTLKFDDAATTSLPQSSKITSGTNKPTAFFPVLTFP